MEGGVCDSRRRSERRLALLERTLWIAAGVTLSMYAVARLDAAVHGGEALRSISQPRDVRSENVTRVDEPNVSSWSASRIDQYRKSLSLVAEDPIAELRIDAVGVHAPIYPDTSELHLNRGAGVIHGMAAPGEGGNLGVAGHRDGYFRALKDLRVGATIDVATRDMRYRYRVTTIEIVERDDVHVLADTDEPSITLVTCYPFYFIGSAPRRYIVRGALERSSPTKPADRRRR